MKEGWEYKKLGEVCRKSNNIKWDDVSNDASFRYIDLTSVDRNDLCIHNPQIITKENAPSRAKQIIKAGDVIFATTRPTLRRVSLIDEIYDGDICSTGFCVLRPNIEINSKFIFHALLNEGFYKYIEPLQTGANYPAVTDSVVKNYIIPVPPLSEQQSIVDYLDSAFAKIDAMKANAEKALNEAKTLFQASLKEMLEPKEGWEECLLKDIAKYSIGLTYKPSDVCDDGTIVLRSSNIQGGKLDLNDKVRVNTKIKEELYVQNGDILMCSRNGSARLVGKVCIIPELKEKMTYGTFMMVIRSAYNPLLYHYFDTGLFRSQIKHGEANMINQITRYMLDEVKLFLPPLSEQQSIVTSLDTLKSKVDRLQANFEKISQECDALKQAILRQVFE